MASRIEEYGLIGNTLTTALVSTGGSIDWFCAPRFDSDACFAALVGRDKHGRWSIHPTVRTRETRQRYRGDTLVLETDSPATAARSASSTSCRSASAATWCASSRASTARCRWRCCSTCASATAPTHR